MKKLLTLSAITLAFASTAYAGSSYVTGNAQFHSEDLHGNSATSTLEAGHTFNNSVGGLTVYTELDGISIGDPVVEGKNNSVGVTIGGEQSYNITENLWVAAGYQHLLVDGETFQYRPLVKIGYNFDNGVSISNRTRLHSYEESGKSNDVRFDNRIAYKLNDEISLSYNNVYVIEGNESKYNTAGDMKKQNTMDHELRMTWTRTGVQPYFEFRSQANGKDNEQGSSIKNNAFVFGASYGF
ncbi:porin [Vibrio europaeus]|uniref:Porin n=1 Tax=Vibrio europaeus TaxID=300876 RepID=A0A178JGS7_9VIBR|nr:oligogalacturonate-specific porin KdgM family protein [Vibrio europaeus]MDC5704592.1 porin [Vibrio europaeus]MDC5712056.1 porin [Vibrio europaeus]MDC5717784.1 porin [Vibrio europaeus]MDC5718129.1 porin [Vibrio europaeus]MDC5727715.1 porin [Vibrio europaeus]